MDLIHFQDELNMHCPNNADRMRDAGCCGQSRIMVEGEQSHPSSNYSLERPEIDEIVKTVGNTRKLRSEGSILKKGGQDY